MTGEEIAQLLRANINKIVRVTYQDGSIDSVLVLTVDDEGFVFDVASIEDGGRKTTEYWTPFSEISDVQITPPEIVR